MTITMTETAEFTVVPRAPYVFGTNERDADTLDKILDELESDPRAHGPAVAFDRERSVVDATFQVDAADTSEAMHLGAQIFDQALAAAGLAAVTDGGQVVRGGPDRL